MLKRLLRILLVILLRILSIALKVLLSIITIIYSISVNIGDFIIGLCIISGIGFLITKNYNAMNLNIIAVIILMFIKLGTEFILGIMIYGYELIQKVRSNLS